MGDTVYKLRFTSEAAMPLADLIKTDAKLIGYNPPLPWTESSLVGNHVILRSNQPLQLGFGYEAIEALPEEKAIHLDWYQQAAESQRRLRDQFVTIRTFLGEPVETR